MSAADLDPARHGLRISGAILPGSAAEKAAGATAVLSLAKEGCITEKEGCITDTCDEHGGLAAFRELAGRPLVLHHAVTMDALTHGLAQSIYDALAAAAPAPTLIICRSGKRACAGAALFTGAKLGASADAVVAAATARGEEWVSVAPLRNWVCAFVTRAAIAGRRGELVFRQLFDGSGGGGSGSSSFTYVLADASTGDAVLIDPVLEHVARDVGLVAEMGLRLRVMLNTHAHADHVTGTGAIKARFAAAAAAAAAAVTVAEKEGEGGQEQEEEEPPLSAIGAASGAAADVQLHHGDKVRFGSRWLEVLETPGHTAGCCCFLLDDHTRVFTGDTLLVRGCGRTDFQGGDAATLHGSVSQQLFTLNTDCTVYPAHDYKGRTSSSIGEERRHNLRLTKTLPEFVEIMAGLNLSTPKLIDIAVPANMRCGLHEDDAAEE